MKTNEKNDFGNQIETTQDYEQLPPPPQPPPSPPYAPPSRDSTLVFILKKIGGFILSIVQFIFGKVYLKEIPTLILLCVSIFFAQASFYLLKTIREPTILGSASSPEIKIYASAFSTVALVVIMPLNNWLQSILSPTKMFFLTTVVIVLNVQLFFVLNILSTGSWPLSNPVSEINANYLSFAFFMWVSIVGLFIVSVFWSTATDVYTKEQAERIFPILALASTLGLGFGSYFGQMLYKNTKLSGYTMAQIMVVFMFIQLAVYFFLTKREKIVRKKLGIKKAIKKKKKKKGQEEEKNSDDDDDDGGEKEEEDEENLTEEERKKRKRLRKEAKKREKMLRMGENQDETTTLNNDGSADFSQKKKSNRACRILKKIAIFFVLLLRGFYLLIKSPYLFMIAVLTVLMGVVHSFDEYYLSKFAVEICQNDKSCLGQFFGNYHFLGGVVTLVFQILCVSNFYRFFGLGASLMILPLLETAVSLLVIFNASITAYKWVTIFSDSVDHSLVYVATNLLWTVTTREEKYNAKRIVDTVFVRSGDIVVAIVVFIGNKYLHFSLGGFAKTNLLPIGLWMATILVLVWLWRGRTKKLKKEKKIMAAATEQQREDEKKLKQEEEEEKKKKAVEQENMGEEDEDPVRFFIDDEKLAKKKHQQQNFRDESPTTTTTATATTTSESFSIRRDNSESLFLNVGVEIDEKN